MENEPKEYYFYYQCLSCKKIFNVKTDSTKIRYDLRSHLIRTTSIDHECIEEPVPDRFYKMINYGMKPSEEAVKTVEYSELKIN